MENLTDEFLTRLLGARNFAIYKMRKDGMSYAEIGRRIGVSGTTVINRFRLAEMLVNDTSWHWRVGLSNRICNSLCNFQLKSRDDLMALYKSGNLQPHGQIRNYGWKCHREVAKWLGLPEPEKTSPKKPKPQFCPHCHARI